MLDSFIVKILKLQHDICIFCFLTIKKQVQKKYLKTIPSKQFSYCYGKQPLSHQLVCRNRICYKTQVLFPCLKIQFGWAPNKNTEPDVS